MDAKATMLAIHIVCGFVALVTMVMAYLTKKGPAMHAKVGRIYGYAMVGVGLTAIVLFFLGASAFLLLIAFFSLYLVLVGWRFAINRKGEVSGVDTARPLAGGGWLWPCRPSRCRCSSVSKAALSPPFESSASHGLPATNPPG